MNAEQFFNKGFGTDVEKVHRKHVIELMTNFAKHYHTEQCNIADVSGSVFPCFTEGGEIFAIAESHSQAVRIAKNRYGKDIPDEMLAAIIDKWELGKHYR